MACAPRFFLSASAAACWATAGATDVIWARPLVSGGFGGVPLQHVHATQLTTTAPAYHWQGLAGGPRRPRPGP